MIWGFLIPSWLRRAVAWIAAVVAALGAAWLAGRRDARKDAAKAEAEARAKTIETVQRIEDDARKLSDSDLADSLTRGVRKTRR